MTGIRLSALSPRATGRTGRLAALLFTLLAAAGCSTTAPGPTMPLPEIHAHPWYHQQHHTDDGFRNIWSAQRDAPFFKAAGWILGHAFRRKENVPPPVRSIAPESLHVRPERLRLTWIGHSNVYVQTPGLDVLLDPMFGDRASPLSFAGPKREVALPIDPDALPGVDVVLISHNHYDHLDEGSIRQLHQLHAPLFLVPLGLGATLRAWGAEGVVELDWWQYVDVDGVRYHCTPAMHFSSRSLLDRNETLWAGWYLESLASDSLRLFYAGDTGYAEHFAEIRDRLGAPDVALLPIGAYLPRWFMAPVHVDPGEAVQAFLDLRARHFVPVHWGTFDLADETLQDAPRELREQAAERGVAERVHLLDVGGAFSLDGEGRW